MSELSDDLLRGARLIAEYLFGASGKKELRSLYRLASEVAPEDRLPTFRLGGPQGPLCARKSKLLGYIEEREQISAARAP